MNMIFLLVSLVTMSGLLTEGQSCSKPVDIVFLIDTSASMTKTDASPVTDWQLLLTFTQTIVNKYEVGDDGAYFGAVTFDTTAQVIFHLQDFTTAAAITSALNTIQPSKEGSTDLYSALNLACTDVLATQQKARLNVPHIIIILTDGKEHINAGKTINEADSCKNNGVTIYAVGITNATDSERLAKISSDPHQRGVNYFITPDYTSLSSVVSVLADGVCSAVAELPPTACSPHCYRCATPNTCDIGGCFDGYDSKSTTAECMPFRK